MANLSSCLLCVVAALVASLDAASLHSGQWTQCPTDVSAQCPDQLGQYPEFYAHPNHCSKYCECANLGIAWEMDCPSGLLWDTTLTTCNWPGSMNCGNRPNP